MEPTVQATTTHRGELFQVEVLNWVDERGRAIRREVVRHPGAVVVVPVLEGGRVVLIRNYRIAVDERLWELPAGKLEPGEDPAAAARRELEEETGYRCRCVRSIGEFYTSPGFADELMRAFVADGLSFVGQRLEPGEHIEVQEMSRREALSMARDGRIRDGKTIAALLLWAWPFGDGAT
jgi:ADP-ribose pyrophosphatase